ncbi:unnamed protein product [Agarophyton chilense]|eukprot:gb/GEZJ01001047.1/.p1 GENE.gb/GEZJ01001047.1/~~gb/GEZJ01001047.1/.p1  ORF type:complete len:490 (-),score=41.56 gb/GEZJ01001047.1/:324-1793(-)
MIAFAPASVATPRTPSHPSPSRTSPASPGHLHRSPRRRRVSFRPASPSARPHVDHASTTSVPSISAFLATPPAPPPPAVIRPPQASHPPEPLPQPFTLRAVNMRLRALVRNKNAFDRCLWLHGQLRQHSIKPDKYTYSLLLTACATVRNSKHAMQLYHELRQNRVAMDDHLRANLLTVVARSKQPDIGFAMWVFASSPKPSLLLCNILIDLFARAHNATGAESVHRYMNAVGIQADAYTVSALIRVHVASAGPAAALLALREMWRAGLSVHVAAFGQVIAAFGQLGMIDEAVALFDEMTVFGVQPQQTTFNILIEACKGRNLQKAFEIYDEMKASTSFRGDRYTFHALINCCLAAREAERVPGLYAAIKRAGFQPNQISYRLALVAAGIMMDIDFMEQVAGDMKNNLCEPRMDTMATLVAAAVRCSDLQAALSHFSNFVSCRDSLRNARFFDEIRGALRRFDEQGLQDLQDSMHTQLVVDELERSCMRE